MDVDALANEIRRVDGNHDLGAGRLAEALMPFITAELEALRRDAERYRWMRTVYADLRGIYQLAEEAFDEAVDAARQQEATNGR